MTEHGNDSERRYPEHYEIVENEGTDGMAYFLCSECEEPVVEFGKSDGMAQAHWFSHRECGCADGRPKHGWRMLQQEEIREVDSAQ